MKIVRRKVVFAGLLVVLSVGGLLGARGVLGTSRGETEGSGTYNGYLEYLKVVHMEAPSDDPTFISLLAQQFGVLMRHEEGISYLEGLLAKHSESLTDLQRARYTAALAQLRASNAHKVPLMKRAAWVNESIEMLETARVLSGNKDFLVRWLAGIVYARLPAMFGRGDAALVDIDWCIERCREQYLPGWERELYFHRALVLQHSGQEGEAARWLAASGYDSLEKESMFVTPYTVSAEFGARMAPESIREIVPGRVFLLSGFEFTEYYFIISRDGSSLISIDAGTRPEASRRAYEAFAARVDDVPPLTDVLFTHAHWDHVGGRATFRALNPEVRFHARANFGEEIAKALEAPRLFTYFFGTAFTRDLMQGYTPDVLIEERTVLEVGGTRFDLIPISGGETEDALLVYMPEESILFAGDFIMPFFGSPFVEEGSPEGFYEAVEIIEELDPRTILHGHAPLTQIYDSPGLLGGLSDGLQWLEGEVRALASERASRTAIHHENLIPPVVLERSELHLPFLVTRENFINRVYDQVSGYWHPDLSGMDYLNEAELGSVFGRYLELSSVEVAEAMGRMIDQGDHELAAKVGEWSVAHYGEDAALEAERVRAYGKLREKYQSLNPFKFIAYSQMIEREMPGTRAPVEEAGSD